MKDKEITSNEKKSHELREKSSSSEIGDFLKAAGEAAVSRSGRLIFALDATMSRQPTWDQAVTIQASMFDAVGKAGGLSVQLVFFRGINECRASKWVINAAALRDLMLGIRCLGGQTQIAKILDHANRETTGAKVSALVFIGDAIEEDIHFLPKSGRTRHKRSALLFLSGWARCQGRKWLSGNGPAYWRSLFSTWARFGKRTRRTAWGGCRICERRFESTFKQ